jgi:hypothetical protein
VQLKREHPSWGAPKIREKLRRQHSQISLPAISTVHTVLDRHGLVSRGLHRERYRAEGTQLSQPTGPNELWCADDKGEFMLADRRYCYPLTITDQMPEAEFMQDLGPVDVAGLQRGLDYSEARFSDTNSQLMSLPSTPLTYSGRLFWKSR